MMIDTHTHLYAEEFDNDRSESILNAIKKGVTKMLLPAIDKSNHPAMMKCASEYPENCFPMIGLHPTSVKEDFRKELDFLKSELPKHKFYGIGECGLDYYWDKTFVYEQEIALREQIELAVIHKLPLVLHSRKSLNELIGIIKDYKNEHISGVFHCFPGSIQDAEKVIELGFYLGIGGVVTYKNATMANVVKNTPLDHIILETDSPYLTPVPNRGKRNESSFVPIIAEKIAELKGILIEEVAEKTTNNAIKLFNL